jgi:hypothetical protein
MNKDQFEKVTPRIDPDDGSAFCLKCDHFLGRVMDKGIYFLAGGARLYGQFSYNCHFCFRGYRFIERLPDPIPTPAGSFETLNALAIERKFKTDEENF